MLEFVTHELDRCIERLGIDSREHKLLFRWLRYCGFVLTACSTVLAGLAIAFSEWHVRIDLAIVVVSAIGGLLVAVEGVRKPGELWIHERTIHYALKDLRRELLFRCAEAVDRVAIEECFGRMQALLATSGEKWSRQIAGTRRATKVDNDATR